MQLSSLSTYFVVHFHSCIITGRGKAFPANINNGQTTHPTLIHYYFDKSPPHPEGHNEAGIIQPKTASRSTQAVINLFTFNSLLHHPFNLHTIHSLSSPRVQSLHSCPGAHQLSPWPAAILTTTTCQAPACCTARSPTQKKGNYKKKMLPSTGSDKLGQLTKNGKS